MAALDGVDLHVAPGEIYGVVGRSGAGKSTLLRAVNLLERPDSGAVRVAGQELTALGPAELRAARRRIGMIFQQFHLLSARTVAGNVALPLELAGVARSQRARRVRELLDLVGLADKAGEHPARLSGGQRQRVAIARALATDPSVLLCDEATSALDPYTTVEILHLLRDLNRRLGLTILLITHDLGVVERICDRAGVLDAGRLVESGPVGGLLGEPGSALSALAQAVR
ncbi:methionine ABC transporter ATP-binding protein [Catellatospora citrea]|uniref:methionine ABC transporter ATP-binding protein n=1 Tax=Catellatospora citrea TaxID=53366 RepID=UPI0033C28F95